MYQEKWIIITIIISICNNIIFIIIIVREYEVNKMIDEEYSRVKLYLYNDEM